MRIDRERMIIDALRVVRSVLMKNKAQRMQRQNPFRLPTKKELDKHPKLMAKQRRKSMGER